MNPIPERGQIPARYKWDLASIYTTDTAWEQAIGRVDEMLKRFAQFQGQLAQCPEKAADCLEAMDAIRLELGKLVVYAHSQFSVDTRDQTASSNQSRAIALVGRALGATAFVEPELLAIGPAPLKQWATENGRLTVYAHYFDTLGRRAAHVRSPDVEELLGQLRDPFRTAQATHSILADADLVFAPAISSTGEEKPVAQGTIDALLTDPDRSVRRSAYESYADAHLAFKNTMANCLANGVKQDVFTARARRYTSALQAAVSSNYVPEEVFHNVIDTFADNLPIWHRYWRIRREALGYDTLQEHDIKAPLVANPAVSLDQSIAWICEGLAPLGEAYVETIRRGVAQQQWVDVYPNQGKSSGAFSSGAPGTHPLVLMSFTDDLYSMSTLAHELGHSMHSYLTWQTQPLVYANYSIFVAEVASNFNQALARDHLLRTQPEPAFQIAIIEEAMSNFHRYMFLMPTLARFELEIHERVERGEALTADGMTSLMSALFREAYGGEVEIDEKRAGITWAAFHTHLYANFYVYQYTTGIAGAQALADRVLNQVPGAVDSYLNFLKSGSSRYPLDALELAGIDLTSREPIQQAFDYLARIVGQLEILLGQL